MTPPPTATPRRPRSWPAAWVVPALLALVAVGALAMRADAQSGTAATGTATTTATVTATVDAATLQRAQGLFAATCAVCHGPSGQGAGMPGMEMPALDASSAAWQKSDVELAMVVKNGASSMPGVGTSWTRDDIRAVVVLISTWWTPEQRSRHDALSTTTGR